MRQDVPISAHNIALNALSDKHGMFSSRLERLLEEKKLPPREAGLAIELVRGVVRRQRTLDAVIKAFSERRKKQLPTDLENILRLAIYQLIFLDRVPDFAAVNEAVEAARRKHPRMAGYVNGLCRNVARSLGQAAEGEFPKDGAAVPLASNRFRSFDKKVFASAEESPQQWLGQVCSLNDDLAARWLVRGGSLPKAFKLAIQADARPLVSARVNLLRISMEDALARLAGEGVEAVAHENGHNVVFTGAANVAELSLFKEGLITPQDPSATAVVLDLDIQSGQRVLDLCAAPGTKTTHIAELLHNTGEVVAADVSEDKLEFIRQAAARCGLKNIRPILAEVAGSLEPHSFDRVLVDAPCSNTGVLAQDRGPLAV